MRRRNLFLRRGNLYLYKRSQNWTYVNHFNNEYHYNNNFSIYQIVDNFMQNYLQVKILYRIFITWKKKESKYTKTQRC